MKIESVLIYFNFKNTDDNSNYNEFLGDIKKIVNKYGIRQINNIFLLNEDFDANPILNNPGLIEQYLDTNKPVTLAVLPFSIVCVNNILQLISQKITRSS